MGSAAAAILPRQSTVRHIWQLDAIRGVTALYIVIHHSEIFRHRRIVGTLFAFGPEAVIVFFVLSGFVISFATEGASVRPTFIEYFRRRFTRIYPLFLLALLLAYLAVCIATRGIVPFHGATFLGNVFMLQDLKSLKAGTWFDTYQANDPLWSLSYEWWFYMAFAGMGWILRSKARFQKYGVFILSAAATLSYLALPSFPGLVIAYWFIWWSGVELNREFLHKGNVSWRTQAPMLLGMALLTALWSIPVFSALSRHLPLGVGFEPMIELRHFFAGDVVLLLVLVYPHLPRRWIASLLKPFVWVGEISYAIYIFHTPIFYLSHRWEFRLVGIVLLFALSYVLEKELQPRFSRWLRPLFPRGTAGGRATAIS